MAKVQSVLFLWFIFTSMLFFALSSSNVCIKVLFYIYNGWIHILKRELLLCFYLLETRQTFWIINIERMCFNLNRSSTNPTTYLWSSWNKLLPVGLVTKILLLKKKTKINGNKRFEIVHTHLCDKNIGFSGCCESASAMTFRTNPSFLPLITPVDQLMFLIIHFRLNIHEI